MIGVVHREGQEYAIEEFFEFFKTPWEYYKESGRYDVILATGDPQKVPVASLVLIFSTCKTESDVGAGIRLEEQKNGPHLIEGGRRPFPVYGPISSFQGTDLKLLNILHTDIPVGIVIPGDGRTIIRVGYDLFDEISFLLKKGQPVEHATSPTIELHIAALRKWVLDFGIQILEIPPVPEDHPFITCLTHDIDFYGIRNHWFDRTIFGFISRVLLPTSIRHKNLPFSLDRFMKNWKALLALPLVHLRIIKDYWDPVDSYRKVEENIPSTFFFIPIRDLPGISDHGTAPSVRAARYDIHDHESSLKKIVKDGGEVGVHGIDAWADSEKARKERKIVGENCGRTPEGIRMHWLYFSEDTPVKLGEAGFSYDSTVGYNDAAGYKAGTTQAYLLPDTGTVFELPLNLQDTAMFFPDRMGLNESQAELLCSRLISDYKEFGGAFTINWHDRSLAPERNWDDFYRQLLTSLKTEKPWFTTAGNAVAWFEGRRSIRFMRAAEPGKNAWMIEGGKPNHLPAYRVRIHSPAMDGGEHGTYMDIRLQDGLVVDMLDKLEAT